MEGNSKKGFVFRKCRLPSLSYVRFDVIFSGSAKILYGTFLDAHSKAERSRWLSYKYSDEIVWLFHCWILYSMILLFYSLSRHTESPKWFFAVVFSRQDFHLKSILFHWKFHLYSNWNYIHSATQVKILFRRNFHTKQSNFILLFFFCYVSLGKF